jgi:predicted permease
MSTSLALVEGVLVMLSVILLAILLKRRNILQKEHSVFFSRLVMKVTLPALIFSSLVLTRFEEKFLMMALVMAAVEIACILLALMIARSLKLGRGETGALILVSAFGMTAMLGYPLISQVFPNDPLALEEAVITSELGVGFLLFILGPLIAMYYGESEVIKKDLAKSVGDFFISPIFIALITGIGFSFIRIDPDNLVFSVVDRFMVIVGNANTLLVCLAVGLVIEVQDARKYATFLVIAVALKLAIKPLMAYCLLRHPVFTEQMQQIVFIETAMPSALLGAVFAKHYNCKPELVSMAVMVTLILSVLSVSALFLWLF